MAHVDPTTFTEATKAMVTQKALLSGIQHSFYVALGMNVVALLLVFVKRVDTSAEAVERLNR